MPKRLTLTHYNVPGNSFWDGEAYFPFWRGEIPVNVCADGGKPSTPQLDLLHSILCHEESIRPDVEAALLHYYQTAIYDPVTIRKKYEEVFRVSLPEVRSTAEMQKLLLGSPSICIGVFSDAQRVRFDLDFDCVWDEEHGVSVEIENWKIVGVGH